MTDNMRISQWWWDKTHYVEKIDVKLTNNSDGTYTSETLNIALNPGDCIRVRTFLPLDKHPTSEFGVFYEKRWYRKLKLALRLTTWRATSKSHQGRPRTT